MSDYRTMQLTRFTLLSVAINQATNHPGWSWAMGGAFGDDMVTETHAILARELRLIAKDLWPELSDHR